jgi:hemoglobin
MADDPTLFDWAGGRDAFDRMINAFYDRVEQDELLSPFPGGVHADHRRNVATWWCEVFGGPTDYTEQLGGYERMLNKHRQLGITEEQRFRFASLMSRAADDARMPDDPEFRAALVGYLEWGTWLALGNSQPGAEVVEQAPVPRWGGGKRRPTDRREWDREREKGHSALSTYRTLNQAVGGSQCGGLEGNRKWPTRQGQHRHKYSQRLAMSPTIFQSS